MVLRKRVILSLCGVVLCVSATAHWPFPTSARAGAGPGEPAVEITLRLDKPEVKAGEPVILEELVPAAMDAQVTSIGHDVLRIGSYDEKLGKLVNPRWPRFSVVNPEKLFDKLPGSLASSHPMLFDITTPKRQGFEFTCRPNRLGSFLITARWYLRNRGASIASNPVVLVVKPPVDASGRPVVKPEWLAADGWERSEGGSIEIRAKP